VTFGHLLTAAGCLIFHRRRAPGPPPRARARAFAARLELRHPARPALVQTTGGWSGRMRGACWAPCSRLRRRIRPCGSGRARHHADGHRTAGADPLRAPGASPRRPVLRARAPARAALDVGDPLDVLRGHELYRQEQWAAAAQVFTISSRPSPRRSGAPIDVSPGPLPRPPRQSGRRVEAWRDTGAALRRHPWAKYAGERLAEVAGEGTGRLTPFTIGIPVFDEEAIVVGQHAAPARLPWTASGASTR